MASQYFKKLLLTFSCFFQLVGKGDVASMKYDRNSDPRQKEMLKMLESAQVCELARFIDKLYLEAILLRTRWWRVDMLVS